MTRQAIANRESRMASGRPSPRYWPFDPGAPGPSSSRRRGSVYIMVLGISMAVTVIGLSALLAVRIERRAAQGTNDMVQARIHAQSAIEMAFLSIRTDSAWRSSRGTGSWDVAKALSTGRYDLDALIVADGDGNAKNNAVQLTGTGVHGRATHRIEVTVIALSDNGGLVVSPGSWKQVVISGP